MNAWTEWNNSICLTWAMQQPLHHFSLFVPGELCEQIELNSSSTCEHWAYDFPIIITYSLIHSNKNSLYIINQVCKILYNFYSLSVFHFWVCFSWIFRAGLISTCLILLWHDGLEKKKKKKGGQSANPLRPLNNSVTSKQNGILARQRHCDLFKANS